MGSGGLWATANDLRYTRNLDVERLLPERLSSPVNYREPGREVVPGPDADTILVALVPIHPSLVLPSSLDPSHSGDTAKLQQSSVQVAPEVSLEGLTLVIAQGNQDHGLYYRSCTLHDRLSHSGVARTARLVGSPGSGQTPHPFL